MVLGINMYTAIGIGICVISITLLFMLYRKHLSRISNARKGVEIPAWRWKQDVPLKVGLMLVLGLGIKILSYGLQQR